MSIAHQWATSKATTENFFPSITNIQTISNEFFLQNISYFISIASEPLVSTAITGDETG